jgi:hypothetical protein
MANKNPDWTDVSHAGRIGLGIMDIMSKEFFIESRMGENKDINKMIKLSQAVGYQLQLYSALYKSHEVEKRLQGIERKIATYSAEDAMKNSPVISAEKELQTLEEGK